MQSITIIAIIAIALLILHWKGPNAVWGGATLGLITGIIAALITQDWSRLPLFFSIAVFVGTFFEWIGRIASKWARK